jgi:ribosomal protein S18 acetylase RimI-like enzyme
VASRRGLQLNLPLPESLDGEAYAAALRRALKRIEAFAPTFLVVALGLDPAKGDPTGTWSLGAADFEANGRAIGALRLPTLVVQEGGYRTRTLGVNARHFLGGLWEALQARVPVARTCRSRRGRDGGGAFGAGALLPQRSPRRRRRGRPRARRGHGEVQPGGDRAGRRPGAGDARRRTRRRVSLPVRRRRRRRRHADLAGYACYGPIPATRESHDLYWIAVAPERQGRGLGRRLLRAVEREVARAGGRRIYVDTSGRDAYAPTRAFYERAGYVREATLPDFYAPGDAKVIYRKQLAEGSADRASPPLAGPPSRDSAERSG